MFKASVKRRAKLIAILFLVSSIYPVTGAVIKHGSFGQLKVLEGDFLDVHRARGKRKLLYKEKLRYRTKLGQILTQRFDDRFEYLLDKNINVQKRSRYSKITWLQTKLLGMEFNYIRRIELGGNVILDRSSRNDSKI